MAWPQVKLDDCVDLLAGFAFKSDHFTSKPDDVPLVKGENVSQGSILWDISKRWPKSDWARFQKFQLAAGDVVIAMDRPWVPAGLKWAFIREDDPGAFLVQRCARLRTKNGKLDQRFLRFLIGGIDFENYVKPITTGVNVPHISGRQILDYSFRLPPIKVQKHIAGILSAYDELVENNRRRIRILEEMARALYREWFVLFRFPGHEKTKLVSSPLGNIPQGWELQKLGDVAECVRRNFAKGELDEAQPYVGLEHIPRRSLALDAWEMTTDLGSSKLEFRKGEILFGKIRPYFHKVSIAPFDGLCSADTIVIRSRQPEYHAVVVGCVSSDDFVAHATATSNGSKMPRANWNVMADHPVAIPPPTISRQYSALIEPAIEQMQLLVFQNVNLRRTRHLLLPRLFSGQVDLSILDQTPPAEAKQAA